ncbi:HAD-IIB family hydrolase [Gelidibacter salicanalis]|uniref:phosphomannomutase n=1 Tax=Gelidibacter salicanalis TaxID=291193 RepID=A0A5C7AIH9_9FLAO|nr:HAD-IIB family hydrolase [Gelidibacter salicanalis]TXE07794.1 HAD-IIB family hydrolase [Gelidibacter salicanalis]
MKNLIVFDLDGTLAQSKLAIDEDMSQLFKKLLEVAQVAIISGGDWPQFKKQVLDHLPIDTALHKLTILPTCGTKFYYYKEGWERLYAENFTEKERHTILNNLHQALEASTLDIKKTWGEQIEDRGSQITFSALGQQAPLEEKKKWDPDFIKRQKIVALLKKPLQAFSIGLGGTTSIDIVKPGIDKAYGIRKLTEVLGVAIPEMLFIGDALFEGGNDYPARKSGVDCIQVRDPEETKTIIRTIILCAT